MITPDVFAPTTYVKMGESATFKWNYTSLIVTPTAIDVVAYCKKNDHGYTILANESVKETGKAVWDTEKDMRGDVPLMNELYTLQIYDSELGPSEIAEAGHLGNSRPFIFGVYSPKPTKGLDGMSLSPSFDYARDRFANDYIPSLQMTSAQHASLPLLAFPLWNARRYSLWSAWFSLPSAHSPGSPAASA